jgi:hypothetical protein
MIVPYFPGRGFGSAADDLANDISALSSETTRLHLLAQELASRSSSPEVSRLLEDIELFGTRVDNFENDPGFVASELVGAQRSYADLWARYAHLQSQQTKNVVLLALGTVALIGVGAYFVWKRG